MRKATRAQWIKCTIAIILYLAFLVWVKSWWGLIVVPFIFDIYITKKIPWSFWKKSKNPTVRSIMSWVDAIVFALVAVYFVNIYVFQNYQIPSSSLEKSLLVGDFLYVSKMSYGPRVPNTPLSMPLAQHTLPIINTKSITVVKPATACPIQNFTIVCIPKITAKIKTITPRIVTICIGAAENATIFVIAYFTNDHVDHFDSPSSRSLTSNSTLVVLYPIHDDNALKKAFFSGIFRSDSTACLSINLKSEALDISILTALEINL